MLDNHLLIRKSKLSPMGRRRMVKGSGNARVQRTNDKMTEHFANRT